MGAVISFLFPNYYELRNLEEPLLAGFKYTTSAEALLGGRYDLENPPPSSARRSLIHPSPLDSIYNSQLYKTLSNYY